MRGAEEAPTSWTLGMWSGIGVVSMRTCWLNLGVMLVLKVYGNTPGFAELALVLERTWWRLWARNGT